ARVREHRRAGYLVDEGAGAPGREDAELQPEPRDRVGEGLARLVGRGEALAVEAAVGLAEEAVEQGEVARVAGHLLDERGQPAERHQRPQPAEEEELPAVVAGRGPGGPAGAAETAHQPGREE